MDDFIKKIEYTHSLCVSELNNRKLGITGEATIQQLEETIIPELECLINKLKTYSLPPKEQRYLISFANAFTVWGWNMNKPTELFIMLTELNEDYKKL